MIAEIMSKVKKTAKKTFEGISNLERTLNSDESDWDKIRNNFNWDDARFFAKVELLPKRKIKVYDSIGDSLIISYEEFKATVKRRKKSSEKYCELMKKREEIERKNPPKRLLTIICNAYNLGLKEAAMNIDIQEYIPQFGEIRVTKELIDKANLISKRTVALKGNKEIYMHMLNFAEKAEQGDFTSRDIFIPYGQVIDEISCADRSPNGRRKTRQEIRKKGMIISGWAHSHATMGTFHSIHEDIPNLRRQVIAKGIPIDIDYIFCGKLRKERFYFFPSLVFNSKGDKPSCAISIKYPRYVLNGKKAEEKDDFFINTSPKLMVLDEKNNIEMNPEVIDREIQERVFFSQKEAEKVDYGIRVIPPGPDKKLYDILRGYNNPNESENTDRENTEYSEPESSKNPKKKFLDNIKSSFKSNFRKAKEKFKKTLDSLGLDNRISSLEHKYNELSKRYAEFELKYNELSVKYDALFRRNAELLKRINNLERKIRRG